MNKDTLIQLFKAPYKRQAFIDNGLLPTLQGKVANLKIYDAQALQAIELTATEQNYAVSAVKYGEFQTLDEIPRTVELYEIIVNDNKQIERSRVGLGALVKKHIIGNNAVLVNFAYQNPEKRSWRFSFIARDGVFQDGEMQITDTHPKRYTYVFGEPEETYKTALDRFFVLGNELEITINKIKDAFAVEAMSKAFFDEYRDVHYAGFVDYLMRSNFKKSAFNGNDKDVRDFVKKLLGRIVFLYFLQKKGWLGAKDTTYKNGDKNFMTNFFKKAGTNDAFYANWLSKLFFDALNNERPNDDFTMPDGEVVKIPYLNGGLFEKESDKYDFLTFPTDLFTNLFEFFDQYNFTIFEDSPEEHTVAVDPEMLGHIFENLLEDNKDKGAFYTPKEIVHYMTQESLIEYLHTQLPDVDRRELENFVKSKVATGSTQLSKEHKAAIDRKLDTVKICDPAIGSGAFPMGLLQEIFGLKERIAYDLGLPWSGELAAKTKENIIQKSIYGVDIERGAVDIARLRFWLSLIVDEEMPKALPNLDYKIVVGNSLVSKFDDTVIEIDWSDDTAKEGLFGQEIAEDKKKLLKEISTKQAKYFTADNALKEKLNFEIRNLKLDILTKQLELMIENKGFKSDSMQGLNKKQIEAWQQTHDWKKALNDLKILKKNTNQDFNHFDWKLDFPEVLNPLVNEETGFDIVIGNPPYIQLQKDEGYLANLYQDKGFECFERTGDIYSLFYERGINLLRINGDLNYITSNKWMRANYGKSTRAFFAKHLPVKIIDLGSGIFDTATVDTNILLIKRAEKPMSSTKTLALNISKVKKINKIDDFQLDWITIDNLSEDTWSILNTQELAIKKQIEKVGKPLKDWEIEIYRGVLTGLNEAFIINTETKNSLCLEDPKSAEILKPILRGKDIKKYKADWAGLWLIESHNGFRKSNGERIEAINIETYPAIKRHLQSFEPKLSKRGDKGITPYNLRNCAYQEEFGKEKIVWADIAKEPSFSIIEPNLFFNNTVYFISGKKLNYLVCLLNSKTLKYYFKKTGTDLGTEGGRYFKQFVENFPIALSKQLREDIISYLGDSVFKLNKTNVQLNEIPNTHISEAFEEVIDALVFELYFPEEFAEKGIEIEKYAQEIFNPIEGLSEEEQIKAIQETYETLREKDNPLRNQIKLMKIELKELLLPILSV